MKSFLELVKRRRSVRKYLNEAIDDKALARILDAGRLAPSGNNSQPWRFIVVKSEGMKRRLFEAAGMQPWILAAPVTIAVVGDIVAKMTKKEFTGTPSIDDPEHTTALLKTIRDASIAADHIVMAAADEGLGSCWVAMFEQKDIKPVLGVPENCYVVALITLGKAAEEPAPTKRHELREIVFEERYGKSMSCL